MPIQLRAHQHQRLTTAPADVSNVVVTPSGGRSLGKVRHLSVETESDTGISNVVFLSGSRSVGVATDPTVVTVPETAPGATFEVNFDGYANTAEMINDCGPVGSTATFICTSDGFRSRMTLVNDGPPGFTKSMQYDWFLGDVEEITIRREMDFRNFGIDPFTAGAGGGPLREIWTEHYSKFSNPFGCVANHPTQGLPPTGLHCVLDAGSQMHGPPFTGKNPGYKYFFITQLAGQGRWEIRTHNGYNENIRVSPHATDPDFDVVIPQPPYNTNPGGNSCFLSEPSRWLRWRTYSRFGDPGTSAQNRTKVWLDDDVILDETASWTTLPGWNQFQSIWFGANMNRGPEFNQFLRWGLLRVFLNDPGW